MPIYIISRSHFIILMAGGGTGSATLFLAEYLNHTNTEVIYLDFSISSMKIAQQRAKIRDLHNIIWINDWIESLPRVGLQSVNFVASAGVLHHLKNNVRGLYILKDLLLLKGGLLIMVYGRFGRTGGKMNVEISSQRLFHNTM